MGVGIPQGSGLLQRPRTPPAPVADPLQQLAADIRRLVGRAVHAPTWLPVEFNKASGEFLTKAYEDQEINSLTVTVTTGELWVYFSETKNANAQPDLRFTPGDTRQLALAPRGYCLTFYANGATTKAKIILGFV